ncbi:MAG: selenide, water dikinase SelD, partial [Candidatus Hydrogenedentes bacterium]|nr:selenide, water dikinase SelD [Candidatus Hydrogenedentota bacterium]
RLTLISNDSLAPYSGMLPGLVAGHYDYYDCHIDLRRLSRFAGCVFIQDEVIGLDVSGKWVLCRNRPPVPYDLLSLNVGSTPDPSGISGVAEYALPAKPVDAFLRGWEEIRARVAQSPTAFRVVVVGGGAGGIELSMSLEYNLRQLRAERGDAMCEPEVHVVTATPEILPTHHPRVRRRVVNALERSGVQVHTERCVSEITRTMVVCGGGHSIPYDALIWVTHASAAPWVAESGLATDDGGFVLVDKFLRSVSHHEVFAAGDTASMTDDPRPKSGVFAVRQGPYLAKNLRHAVAGETLEAYRPQRRFLSLISTGGPNAIASRGGWTFEGPAIWRWKDRIDRKFMDRYADLPAMHAMSNGTGAMDATDDMEMRCGGCGCKVGGEILSKALRRLNVEKGSGVIIGLDHPDDAAVVELPAGSLAVHTVDFFKSFLDDPYDFGRVTANHCLSDIYAMGATPQSALAIVTLPYGDDRATEEMLYDVLAGAVSVLGEERASLVGGHTTEGSEFTFGLSVNGYVDRDRVLRKGGMRSGDVLILTKPIGTGVLFAAEMRGETHGDWISEAIASMLVSNREAALCLFRHGATACTDVTGFGLLGHLVEMLDESKAAAEIELDALPLLRGAAECSAQGIASTLYPHNARRASALRNGDAAVEHPVYPLLFDPQTAGGLLASIPAEQAQACVVALRESGYAHATVIGSVIPRDASPGCVSLSR